MKIFFSYKLSFVTKRALKKSFYHKAMHFLSSLKEHKASEHRQIIYHSDKIT